MCRGWDHHFYVEVGIRCRCVSFVSCHQKLVAHRRGVVPQEWKDALVIPLFKKGSRDDQGNYKPISILSVVGKLCEKVASLQLSEYLQSHNMLTSNQHGFRSGHSTETAMLEIVRYLTVWIKVVYQPYW